MNDRFDFVVVGSGPGGQKAAVCAAKAGRRVALVEQTRQLGGTCVLRGTIPSKTLRENAVRAVELRQAAKRLGSDAREDLELALLLGRLDEVVSRYAETIETQLIRNGVTRIHGRARFASPTVVEVGSVSGDTRRLEAEHVVLATGSRPRHPEGIPVDHETILDSDSILSIAYLPASLLVLGGGVIACEYASTFAALGVEVTLVDRAARPLGFLDAEIGAEFVRAFERAGGRVLSAHNIAEIGPDGIGGVSLHLAEGPRLRADKALVTLGRIPCLDDLDLAAAGLELDDRGHLEVDAHGRTRVPHIYAVGDAVGRPSLATAAMEQGRRAVRSALALGDTGFGGAVPTGIYTLPEIGSVGATQAEVESSYGGARVGRARFEEVARVQIADLGRGLLKLVADPDGGKLLGVHAIGHGAADLVHLGQLAIAAGAAVDDLIENVFNFPTLAETYRIAALDLVNRQAKPE